MKIFEGAHIVESEVYHSLKTVIDPEIGLNIVDLGFIYKIEYTEKNEIQIEMTLSTKGCPMGDVIIENIHTTLQKLFPEIKSTVQLVWSPPWSPDFLTPEGRKALES